MLSSSKSSPPSRSEVRTFPYPSIWQDEARVQVLLAPFRERTVNPENYDSKMKFWKDVIAEYCFFIGTASFGKLELQQTFTKGHRVPLCLETVIEEMLRVKEIRFRNEYEYDPTNSWSGWALNKFWKCPLNKIKNVLSTSTETVEYVHLGVIKKYCNDLQDIFKRAPFPGTLLSYGDLKEKVFALVNMCEEGLDMCLLTLFCQRKIGLSYTTDTNGNKSNRIHLIKIPSQSDTCVEITEGDLAMHNLMMTKESLEKQLADIELQITENQNKAIQNIKEGKRLLAKTSLRRKHLLEKNHEKRSVALHNIETLISNVDDAKHNGMILDAYKYGSKALQDALKASNLTYDNVEEVVSEVRETVDISNELQDTLGKVDFNEPSYNIHEDELEQELRELLGETANTKSSGEKDIVHNNNICSESIPQKVDISDAELIAMLKGLEVEQKTPGKNISIGASDM